MRQFVIPYIMISDTLKAIELYKEVFGGEVRYTMYGKDMPNCPEDELDRVMHLEYLLKDNLFYFADSVIEDHGRIQLHLNYAFEDKDEMFASFAKMKEHGTVVAELKEEFWGAVYGLIKDPFGIHWQFHCPAKKR